MAYVDGFVLVIPTKNLDDYRKLARISSKVWKDHGALQYVETVGDDLDTKCGVAFPKLTRAKPGETVLFSWIMYKNRAQRDKINAKVMNAPRLLKAFDPKNLPFNVKRMWCGGFKTMVSI